MYIYGVKKQGTLSQLHSKTRKSSEEKRQRLR